MAAFVVDLVFISCPLRLAAESVVVVKSLCLIRPVALSSTIVPADFTVPFTETLMPVAKRLFVKHISQAA